MINQSVRELAIMNIVHNLAQNPNLSREVLAQLANDEDWRIGVAVARHPNTPKQALEQLAHSSWQVRTAAAYNPNTPVTILEQLIKDGNYFVEEAAITTLSQHNYNHIILKQFTAVNNPAMDADTLTELATSRSLLIRVCAAGHPNTPANILEQLAADNKVDVCMAVAQNSCTPIYLLEQLIEKETENEQIKLAAIKNLLDRKAEGSWVFLEEYAKSNHPTSSRLFVFLHPMAPSTILAKNFRSWSWLERYAIAQNLNTPKHILHQLAQDSNRIVGAAAKANLANPT